MIDARRTMRRNMKYGGTIIELARKKKKIRKPRLVVICDVSRSMDTYSRFLLQFIHAMQNTIGKVESFVFSTSLTRVTEYFKNEDIIEALDRIAREVHDWSGGTRIGQSLTTFNEIWARKLVEPPHDRGDPERRPGHRRRRDPARRRWRSFRSTPARWSGSTRCSAARTTVRWRAA